MLNILEVNCLNRHYDAFSLKNITFQVAPGEICALAGAKGAGKTTLLQALLNPLEGSAGEVSVFDMEMHNYETTIKAQLGYVSANPLFYPRKTLRSLAKTTAAFYRSWHWEDYQHYLEYFGLDETKTVAQLSEKERTLSVLSLALAHRPRLLMIDGMETLADKPTQHLLLKLFIGLKKEGTAILFSSDIDSQLLECTDHLLYLRQGKLIADEKTGSFRKRYGHSNETLSAILQRLEKEARHE